MNQPAASQSSTMRIQDAESIERRSHRRYDMESQGITVERCGAGPQRRETLGQIVDLSAMGVRVRTKDASVKVDNQIRIRIDLPAYAGIHPFVDTATGEPQPKREWVGWMAVSRVQRTGPATYELGGKLVDMEEIDRGMLGLYLSTQPLAA